MGNQSQLECWIHGRLICAGMEVSAGMVPWEAGPAGPHWDAGYCTSGELIHHTGMLELWGLVLIGMLGQWGTDSYWDAGPVEDWSLWDAMGPHGGL